MTDSPIKFIVLGGFGKDQTARLQEALRAFGEVYSPAGNNDWAALEECRIVIAQWRALHPHVRIIYVGHSWGGEAVLKLAEYSAEVVTIDAVQKEQWWKTGELYAGELFVIPFVRSSFPGLPPGAAHVRAIGKRLIPPVTLQGDHNSILEDSGVRQIVATMIERFRLPHPPIVETKSLESSPAPLAEGIQS